MLHNILYMQHYPIFASYSPVKDRKMLKTTISPSFTMIPEEQFEDLKSKILQLFELKKEEIKMKDYVSKEKACNHFGWGEATWYRLRKDGLIKVYRLGKKQYIRISEIEQTLEDGLI